jgi:hypothetical protein
MVIKTSRASYGWREDILVSVNGFRNLFFKYSFEQGLFSVKYLSFAFCLLVFIHNNVSAQTDSSAGVFSKGGVSGIGARPLGMGGAFSTVADSGDAIFYNPAGLVQVLRPEISGMGAILLNGKEDLYDLAYVQPFSDQLAWAFAVQELNYNNPTNEESDRIFYGSFAAPLAVDKSFSFGMNVKLFTVSSSNLPTYSAQGIGLDMGFLYHLPILDPRYGKRINLGLSAEDLDTTINWQGGAVNTVPLRVRGGFSYEFNDDLLAAFEFSDFDDTNLATHNTLLLAGIESWFFEDQLGLRTGYTGFQTLDGQFTAGISYRSHTWGIDYAYIGHSQFLGASHRISANWRFGDTFFAKAQSFIPEGVTSYVQGDIITLKWLGSPTVSVDGYNVYFSKTSGSGYVKINKNPLKTTYYALRGLEKNTQYYFVVTTVTDTKPPVESQYSREVLAITTAAPGAPVVVQSQVENEGVVDIAKQAQMGSFPDPVKSGLRGYNIYISEVSGGRFDRVNGQPISNVPTYLVRKLKVGQRYFFKFTSVGSDGSESVPTQELSFIALPYNTVIQTNTTNISGANTTPNTKP